MPYFERFVGIALDICMTKAEYSLYLRSPTWAKFKARYAASSRPQLCFICNGTPHAHHHLTYRRLGHELLEDVVKVCRSCHSVVHHAHSTRYTPCQTILSITHSIRSLYQQCLKDGTADDFQLIAHALYEARIRKPRPSSGLTD